MVSQHPQVDDGTGFDKKSRKDQVEYMTYIRSIGQWLQKIVFSKKTDETIHGMVSREQ